MNRKAREAQSLFINNRLECYYLLIVVVVVVVTVSYVNYRSVTHFILR